MARRPVTLHSALGDALDNLPRQVLLRVIQAKLEDEGYPDKTEYAAALADHVISGSTEDMLWDDPELERLELEINAVDLQRMEDAQAELLSRVPDFVNEVIDHAGKDFARRLRSDWTIREARLEADHAGFLIRLRQRWEAPLSRLRMLLAMCLDVGERSGTALRRSRGRRNRYLREVLVRLHARASQVTGEIICLMENGFADGAMARWRTLHELTTVARFIHRHGDRAAERYLAYDVVEALSEFKAHKKAALASGGQAPSQAEEEVFTLPVQQAQQRYGEGFSKRYGWAAEALGKSQPTFDDIQAAVGPVDIGPLYKFASQNVHAGVRGLWFRLGQFGSSTVLAGPSNAGLEEPGHRTAQSMALITYLLMNWRLTDDIAWMKAISEVAAETTDLFHRCRRQLEREQKASQKKKGTKAVARKVGRNVGRRPSRLTK